MHSQLNQLLDQIRNPTKRNWIIMVPNSLAETVAVCGLASGFVEKHGHGITLVIPPSHAFVVECYPNTFDRVVYMSLEDMRAFSTSGFTPAHFFQLDFPINTWPQQHGDGRLYALYELWMDTVGRAGLDFINLYRYVLRLDWHSRFEFLRVPESSYAEAAQLISAHGIQKGKSVIIFIGNNSNAPSPAALWMKIAQLYQAKGFDIYINKLGAMFVPKGLSIPHAKFIDIPLHLAVPVCEHAGHVVSGTNGFVFMALAAHIQATMNILLPTAVCNDYANMTFKAVSYVSGCTQLCAPDVTCNAYNLKEWIVTAVEDNWDAIAYGIVENQNNAYVISS